MSHRSEATAEPGAGSPVTPFRDGLFRDEPFALLGTRCPSCAATSFPVRAFCPSCRATDGLEVIALPTRGHVHTFTIVRQAPEGVDVPYVLARVELEDGTRVMAQVHTPDPEQVAIDAPVVLVPAIFRARPGMETGGFAFTTVLEEAAS